MTGSLTALRIGAFAILAVSVWAQLPDGPGKEETQRVCKVCHELERSVSPRQDRDGWQQTLDKMVALGAEVTEKEYNAILDYLVKNYPGEEIPKLNVNKATAIELESRLTLPRSQAAAIIEYRTKNGAFKSIDDLKKVPGVDTARIEAKKDRITF
jgi:competence protein ComEA